jgi:endonuclease YncB( thermonuclease family)
MKKIVFLATILLIANTAFAFTGSVTRVSDGDTIVVQREDGSTVKVRLYGIDTPESKQVFGPQATRFTAGKVLHDVVKIVEKDVDRYGRSVALVYTQDGGLLNEDLVDNGFAWVYDRYCKIDECQDWSKMQQSAKSFRKGMWQDPEIVAPWDFRKSKRK